MGYGRGLQSWGAIVFTEHSLTAKTQDTRTTDTMAKLKSRTKA